MGDAYEAMDAMTPGRQLRPPVTTTMPLDAVTDHLHAASPRTSWPGISRDDAATLAAAAVDYFRPALVALGTLAWEQYGRVSVPGPLARTMLAEWGVTGPLADLILDAGAG